MATPAHNRSASSHFQVKFTQPLHAVSLTQTVNHSLVAVGASNATSEAMRIKEEEFRLLQEQVENQKQLLQAVGLLCEKIDEQERARVSSIAKCKQIVIELSIAIASHVTQLKLDADSFQLERVVEKLLEQTGIDIKTVLYLHPDDLKKLRSDFESELVNRKVKIRPDTQLRQGHCRIKNNKVHLANEIHETILQIKEVLLTEVQSD